MRLLASILTGSGNMNAHRSGILFLTACEMWYPGLVGAMCGSSGHDLEAVEISRKLYELLNSDISDVEATR